jgi:hypothetical protein
MKTHRIRKTMIEGVPDGCAYFLSFTGSGEELQQKHKRMSLLLTKF